MVKEINECIVACENCACECLDMKMVDCVNACLVCERVCKALKVAMKFDKNNKQLIEHLKKSCDIACKECIKNCRESKKDCCVKCVQKCTNLIKSGGKKQASKKQSRKK